ncbi:HAD-IA family hydrolase [Nibrella saemangeumensis]|uniref:HAD-IA family hydrolase n=1 Tax=Nibrella saemangeumensis TaxID=1084526 RepID=A0ABP8MRV2_9BACT
MYKLVIFDFDGTLANSLPAFGQVLNELAELHHFRRVDESLVDRLRSMGARQIMQELRIPYWKIPFIGRDAKRLMARHVNEIFLFEGIDRVLQQLSQAGVTLALVTSNSHENVVQIMGEKNVGLLKYIECGSSLFGKRSKIRKVLKKSGFAASETLCIGDEIRDIEAAHEEGTAFGAVGWGYTTIDALRAYQPKVVFTHPVDIVALLTND